MLFYGSFCMQAFDYPLFCGTLCSQLAECMHIYVVRGLSSYPNLFFYSFSPIFCIFGPGPIAICPLPVAVCDAARMVFYRKFCFGILKTAWFFRPF